MHIKTPGCFSFGCFSLRCRFSKAFQEEHKKKQKEKKGEVEGGEPEQVGAASSRIVFDILAEGDEAGERSNQRSDPADVDADEQIGIVLRKGGEQDCRGNVADALAGEHTDKQRVLGKQPFKEIPHGMDPRQIARKNEKENEGEKQGVIHHAKRTAVGKQQNDRNDDQPDRVRHPAKDDGNGKRKQHKIQHRAAKGQADFFLRQRKRLRLYENQAKDRNEQNRKGKGRRHDGKKLRGGNGKFRV